MIEHPTLQPRPQKVGAGWYVQIIWPNGASDQVSGFDTEAAAIEWIENKSEEWIKVKRGDGTPRPPSEQRE